MFLFVLKNLFFNMLLKKLFERIIKIFRYFYLNGASGFIVVIILNLGYLFLILNDNLEV